LALYRPAITRMSSLKGLRIFLRKQWQPRVLLMVKRSWSRIKHALVARLPAAVSRKLMKRISQYKTNRNTSMHQVDWKSPAEVLEKLIQHEAVHAIDGWDDLRRRLQPDRRCFAFFHPQLPSEPLIFVEVALLPEIPTVITPLVDKKAETLDQPSQFKVAVFYSISNCEPGSRANSATKRQTPYPNRNKPETFPTARGLLAYTHKTIPRKMPSPSN